MLKFDTVQKFLPIHVFKTSFKCSTFERQYLNHTISFNSNTFSKWASFKKFSISQQQPVLHGFTISKHRVFCMYIHIFTNTYTLESWESAHHWPRLYHGLVIVYRSSHQAGLWAPSKFKDAKMKLTKGATLLDENTTILLIFFFILATFSGKICQFSQI